jgi:hypothetical protein
LETRQVLEWLVLIAGIGQLGLAIGSLWVPGVLNWRADVAKLRPLTRQVFWTYAIYIWGTNVAFGLVSTLIPTALLDQSPLASAVTGFMAVYWSGRIVIQFTYFDRSDAPTGRLVQFAEFVLVATFLFLAGTYGWACLFNALGSSG